MNTSVKRYKRFSPALIALTLVVGMGLLLWFGILPFQHRVTDKADDIQEYHATRENRLAQMSRLPELQAQFERIQMEEAVLGILLTEERVVDFVQTLERLAEETDVHILIRSKSGNIIEEKAKLKTPSKKANGTSDADGEASGKQPKAPPTILESLPFDRFLRVEVVATGEYQAIVTFLRRMETLSFGLDVIGMTMKTREAEEGGQVSLGSPSRNPFLLLGGQETVALNNDQSGEEKIAGSIEAVFDTVVYLDKQ